MLDSKPDHQTFVHPFSDSGLGRTLDGGAADIHAATHMSCLVPRIHSSAIVGARRRGSKQPRSRIDREKRRQDGSVAGHDMRTAVENVFPLAVRLGLQYLDLRPVFSGNVRTSL